MRIITSRWKSILASVVALFVGVSIGGGTPEPTAAEQPEPEVITETEVVTETETVYQTPQACLDFISTARDVNNISSEFANVVAQNMEVARDAVMAAGTRDIDAMNDATDRQERLNRQVSALTDRLMDKVGPFNELAEECESNASA